VSKVRALYSRLLLRSEVLANLQKDAALDTPGRQFAVQVAQTQEENADPLRLNEAARQVVRAPGADRDAYALALRQSEAAVRHSPEAGETLNTLGVARYRVGDHSGALEALVKSETHNTKKYSPLPSDLAFLALAHQQLGHKEQARAALARLRAVMEQPRWAQDAEARNFLREAEQSIEIQSGEQK
jgi:hypothetical protein